MECMQVDSGKMLKRMYERDIDNNYFFGLCVHVSLYVSF